MVLLTLIHSTRHLTLSFSGACWFIFHKANVYLGRFRLISQNLFIKVLIEYIGSVEKQLFSSQSLVNTRQETCSSTLKLYCKLGVFGKRLQDTLHMRTLNDICLAI